MPAPRTERTRSTFSSRKALASPDPGFDIELTGSHDTMYDVARRWPHRQALADRIARYLEARSEKHTEEHA